MQNRCSFTCFSLLKSQFIASKTEHRVGRVYLIDRVILKTLPEKKSAADVTNRSGNGGHKIWPYHQLFPSPSPRVFQCIYPHGFILPFIYFIVFFGKFERMGLLSAIFMLSYFWIFVIVLMYIPFPRRFFSVHEHVGLFLTSQCARYVGHCKVFPAAKEMGSDVSPNISMARFRTSMRQPRFGTEVIVFNTFVPPPSRGWM